MMRPVVFALLLLGGCGLFRAAPPAVVDETPAERACRAEARAAPAVRELAEESNPNSQPNVERLAAERQLGENRAFGACLRRQGLAAPGGVEPLRRR